MNIEEGLENLTNRVLPPVKLEGYESGQYSSLQEVEDEMDAYWCEYKQENGLEEFGDLHQIFDVNYSGGILRSESLEVESADYMLRFQEGSEGYSAEYFTTQHFGDRESPAVPEFFRGFLQENFEPVEEL